MEDLWLGGKSTLAALTGLVDRAESTMDASPCLYWSLLPEPDRRGHDGMVDRSFWSSSVQAVDLRSTPAWRPQLGRSVRIRIVESPGFEEPATASESARLRASHPDQIDVRTISIEDWFGSGIMHQKLWIVDGRSLYVGSANNNWRSLAQVKELGIVIEDAPEVAADAQDYFEASVAVRRYWSRRGSTAVVFDDDSQINRRVPAWSSLVPVEQREGNPLDRVDRPARGSWERPVEMRLDGEVGQLVLSGAPRELCVGGRTFDGDLLVATILDAESTVCINMMDFAPVGIYRPPETEGQDPLPPVWWPALFDALVRSVSTRRVQARLLVSEWAHTSHFVAPYLEGLDVVARAASANPHVSVGTLEIRRFRVPGWSETGPRADDGLPTLYPGHTRVNHVKYVVTDRRANVGTSNMTWDYFSATAGTSVNLSHRQVVDRLQALFDRDWDSRYSSPLAR